MRLYADLAHAGTKHAVPVREEFDCRLEDDRLLWCSPIRAVR